MKRGAAPFIALTLLGACAVGPDYARPDIAVPPSYGARPADAAPAGDLARWWIYFHDPVLDSLIARALAGNLDVQRAASRVAQARAQQNGVRRSGDPQVNASGQGGYTRLSENALPSALTHLGQGGGSALGIPGEGFPTFQLGFDASWEIDLFGGRRRANEAATARTDGAIWSQRDAEVVLVAEVANTYQQYCALRTRIATIDARVALGRELLGFIETRAANGLTTTLDERGQQRAIEELSAQRETVAADAAARLHALAVLLGLAPAALDVELGAISPQPAATMEIPAGLPSELLQRRPDIRAAERQLAAATADIGVAVADLYPKFSLTGMLQLSSRALTNLLSVDSIMANGAGRLSVPLLEQGGKRATVQVREAQAREALLVYQATVLRALKDVEDALTRLDADRRRAAHLRAAVTAAEDAADTVGVRYRNGLVTYLDVLQARDALLTARDALLQADAAAAQDMVALYKALGGGWDDRRAPIEEGTPNAN